MVEIKAIVCEMGELEKRLENIEHSIAFTKHQAREITCTRLPCSHVCEKVQRQRAVQRKLEGEKVQVMACMAIQEICLNKSCADFEAQDDVLRMIVDFATV